MIWVLQPNDMQQKGCIMLIRLIKFAEPIKVSKSQITSLFIRQRYDLNSTQVFFNKLGSYSINVAM